MDCNWEYDIWCCSECGETNTDYVEVCPVCGIGTLSFGASSTTPAVSPRPSSPANAKGLGFNDLIGEDELETGHEQIHPESPKERGPSSTNPHTEWSIVDYDLGRLGSQFELEGVDSDSEGPGDVEVVQPDHFEDAKSDRSGAASKDGGVMDRLKELYISSTSSDEEEGNRMYMRKKKQRSAGKFKRTHGQIEAISDSGDDAHDDNNPEARRLRRRLRRPGPEGRQGSLVFEDTALPNANNCEDVQEPEVVSVKRTKGEGLGHEDRKKGSASLLKESIPETLSESVPEPVKTEEADAWWSPSPFNFNGKKKKKKGKNGIVKEEEATTKEKEDTEYEKPEQEKGELERTEDEEVEALGTGSKNELSDEEAEGRPSNELTNVAESVAEVPRMSQLSGIGSHDGNNLMLDGDGILPHEGITSLNHTLRSQLSDSGDEQMSMYAESIFSQESAWSSATGVSTAGGYTEVEVATATKELLNIFEEDAAITQLYQRAIDHPHIGPDRLQRNLHRLLKIYSQNLHREAHGELERLASQLVAVKARYVARCVIERFHVKPSAAIRRYHPVDMRAEDSDQEEADQEDAIPPIDEDRFEDIVLLHQFLVESNAFRMFQEQLKTFVQPKPTQPTLKTSTAMNKTDCPVDDVQTLDMPATPDQELTETASRSRGRHRSLPHSIRYYCNILLVAAGCLEPPLSPGMIRLRWKCVSICYNLYT